MRNKHEFSIKNDELGIRNCFLITNYELGIKNFSLLAEVTR